MSAIRNKNTAPEIKVRRALHSLGFRYRLHRRDLPGRPDIVIPKYKAVVFVHGCFWHIHSCPWGKPKPATNSDFWAQKRAGNVERDQRNRAALEAAGWRVFVVWECETKDNKLLNTVITRIAAELVPGFTEPHCLNRPLVVSLSCHEPTKWPDSGMTSIKGEAHRDGCDSTG